MRIPLVVGSREQLAARDGGLVARELDVRDGGQQVAVVLEPLAHELLEHVVAEHLPPGEIRDGGLLLWRVAEGWGCRQLGRLVVRADRAAGERCGQGHREGEPSDHSRPPATGEGAAGTGVSSDSCLPRLARLSTT